MRQMERNKRKVFVAQRHSADGVEIYGTPLEVRLAFRNARSAAGLEGLGEAVSGSLVGTTDAKTAANFHEFDKVYVFTEAPLVADPDASDADYVVESVMPHLNSVEIRLVRVNL